jgi:hypothetical protein
MSAAKVRDLILVVQETGARNWCKKLVQEAGARNWCKKLEGIGRN